MKIVSNGLVLMTAVAVFVLAAPLSAISADQDANKQILKDAVQGAVTGAVATEGSKDTTPEKDATVDRDHNRDKDNDRDGDDSKHKKKKHFKQGHRPPGWDKGRKEGWGGGDEPPGFQKGNKKGWDADDIKRDADENPARGEGHGHK